MTCRFACAAATFALLAACGGSDKPPTLGAMAGTYATTAIQCGGGAGPPLVLALITPTKGCRPSIPAVAAFGRFQASAAASAPLERREP